MKNFLIICSIFVFAYFVRFYNFEERIIFWTEQALSLETSINYLQKPSLLGQEYFRQDSNFHTIYSGALFNYFLLPLILISGYNPVKITIFFTLLNILTGLAVFLVSKRFFGIKSAIFSSILFLFSNLMIYHSLFIWNYNFLPLIGLIAFYLSVRNYKEFKIESYLYLGIICGIGISIQILFVIYCLGVYLVNIIKSKKIILSTLLFITGVTLGNLPMFLFDLRHDFYQTRTIWQFFIDTINNKSDANFAYYYLLPLVPIISIFFGWVLSKINSYTSLIIVIMFLYFNLNSAFRASDNTLTVDQIDYTTRIIAGDAKSDFNIASEIDFDKRAYPIRYYLKYIYHKNVLGVDKYKDINLLYVLAPVNYNYKNSETWEIKAGGSYKVTELKSINDEYSLYKLTK